MRQLAKLTICVGLSLPAYATSAEFFIETRADGSTLFVLDGEIQDGDRDKMVAAIENAPVKFIVANGMKVNSSGGSVTEALKIAQVIEDSGLMLNVEKGDVCASACFILFASAPYRWADSEAKILVHRPYFAETPKGGEEFAEIVKAHQAAMTEMRAYLQARSVPSSLIDKMMKYPSSNAYRLSFNDIYKEMGLMSPVLEELTLKKCGLTNANIYRRSNDAGDTDRACIGEFLYPMKNDYLRALIGNAKFDTAFDKAGDILSD